METDCQPKEKDNLAFHQEKAKKFQPVPEDARKASLSIAPEVEEPTIVDLQSLKCWINSGVIIDY